MKSITIKIHSFIDTITNSSTSIYVEATDGTIKTLKELIDILLKLGGSTKTANDLLTFKLINNRLEDKISDYLYDKFYDYLATQTPNWKSLDLEARAKIKDKLIKKIDAGTESFDWYSNPTAQEDFIDEYGADDEYSSVSLKVTPKDANKDIETIAEIMSDLTGLFNIEACYNG